MSWQLTIASNGREAAVIRATHLPAHGADQAATITQSPQRHSMVSVK
jgi:hypothetical protein